ncbi:Nulp1-pending protein [Cordyceps javanica]|uniref:Nulp1-pending protein n=1 Tax=Cordyceps javanica TaxID=43265 RepID=A0A545VY09_9HYPO|nr:Nulp1-pending protein [Cordyceps javanica]TQW06609.1 Nulp1-pending protein [Cordyceps javanica]
MSSRQLRKLQKQRELEEVLDKQGNESDRGEESDDEPAPAARPKPNLFAALGGDDEVDAEADDDEDDDGGAIIESATSEAKPQVSGKKKKKKKKSKKKATAAAAADDQQAAGGSEEDEIDKALKALKLANAGKGTSEQDEENQRRAVAANSILQINTYHLRAINEMRNLFGREVIESANAEEERQQQEQQQQLLRGRGGHAALQVDLETFLRSQPPNAKKLPEVSLRRNIFVQGRDHWPAQSAGGLTMRETARAADGSSTEYAYLHEGDYDALQIFFFACVQVGDPMRMVNLLKRVPYHVSTLLQVSAVAKQDQNMALSAELCERALFTFGRVTTSAFRQNLEQGRARLDFRRPENRQFWLAGYHYLRSLLRKGTYRTALEWAKLLYALDPEDPYAMRHYLHFLAVRAYESKWLLDFLQHVQGDDADSVREDFVYVKQSAILARLQLGETETARKELAEGIRTVPWLYCALFQELGLDAPPSIWGVHAESDARQFWVKLYLHFTKDLWNNTQATSLLTQVAGSLDKVRVADLPSDDAAPGLDATRLVYLEGQTSLIALAPRELLDRQPNYDFDPMPPAYEDNIFTYQGTKLPWSEKRGGDANDDDDDDDDEANNGPNIQEMLARMRNNLPGPAGGGGRPIQGLGQLDGDDNSDYDDETDEELRRDLEEHARRSRAPGYLGQLMQMMGIGGGGGGGGGSGDPADDEAHGAQEQGDVDDDDDDVPGAWPGATR